MIAAIAAVVVLLILVASVVPFSSDILRKRVVATLSDRLESDVELTGLRLRILPQFHVEGSGLSIRHRGRRDVPPLIAVESFTVDASLASVIHRHISDVTLHGLVINIPPDHGDLVKTGNSADSKGEQAANGQAAEPPAKPKNGGDSGDANSTAKTIVVDRLNSSDARLVIIPREQNKTPKVWEIHRLAMQSVSFDHAMPYDATVTNAVPPGEIQTKGSFGPWQPSSPGETPLDGTFTFSDADLSVFKGISGILASHGDFKGSLNKIGIHGITDTPKFTVSVSGHPVPLHAEYRATVDGTNGNTLLDRIDASFLNTSLVAKGGVVGIPGKKGRTVTLDIVMDKARIEDVLRLAVKAPQSPMTGTMKLRTKFVLPPGDRDVVEKLQLAGDFEIGTAKFTTLDIQKKVDALSRRTRGATEEEAGAESSVVSNFAGRFKLGGGTLQLPSLMFNMPGTRVELAGSYALRPETLDFKGKLLMEATISETQKGWKRFALKVLDPIFAKKGGGGGSEIPIKIGGKRNNPSFGLDGKALLKRGK